MKLQFNSEQSSIILVTVGCGHQLCPFFRDQSQNGGSIIDYNKFQVAFYIFLRLWSGVVLQAWVDDIFTESSVKRVTGFLTCQPLFPRLRAHHRRLCENCSSFDFLFVRNFVNGIFLRNIRSTRRPSGSGSVASCSMVVNQFVQHSITFNTLRKDYGSSILNETLAWCYC